jgi:hypothetical protein
MKRSIIYRFAKPKLVPSRLDHALRMGLDYIGIETMTKSGLASRAATALRARSLRSSGVMVSSASKAQFRARVVMEERTFADIPPHHLHGAVAGLADRRFACAVAAGSAGVEADAKLAHKGGAKLDQIQLSLGHDPSRR